MGLRVIDVSNPEDPSEVGFYDTPGNAQGVAVTGDYAYVADACEGLRVVDVSDPEDPSEVGFYDTPAVALDVTVAGGYAYVADRWEGLRVVDVSDPENPSGVGLYDTPGDTWRVAVAGFNTYVADWGGGLLVLRYTGLCPDALTGVGITGPAMVTNRGAWSFRARVWPLGATLPITYTWVPEPHEGQGTSEVHYSWANTGTVTLTVSAEKCWTLVSGTHRVDVRNKLWVYLPIVLR